MVRVKKENTYKKLDEAMKAKQLGEIVVAQDVTKEGIKQYRIFKSYDELQKEIDERLIDGKQNHFYEVIQFPCYMYVDVDMIEEIKDIEEGLDEVQDFFKGTKANVYSSSKTSYHFKYPGMKINSMEEGKAKCSELTEKLKHPIKDSIDLHVYGNRRLFRMMNCTKKGKNEVKVPIRGNLSFAESMVNI